MKKNQRCEYGQVFGECGENRNIVRVAHHSVSEDSGLTYHSVCSNCLGYYFCETDSDISTFGYFNPHTCEATETYNEHLKLGHFNEEEFEINKTRRSKKDKFF